MRFSALILVILSLSGKLLALFFILFVVFRLLCLFDCVCVCVCVCVGGGGGGGSYEFVLLLFLFVFN